MSERAEQEVLDFLRRVSEHAGGMLRSDQRRDFLARLRARIDEARTDSRATEPEQVRKVLARFGEPAQLVQRERRRLESEQRQRGRSGGSGGSGGSGAGATSGERTAPAGLTSSAAARDEPSSPVRPVTGLDEDSTSSTQPIPVVRDEAAAGQGEQQEQRAQRQAEPTRPAFGTRTRSTAAQRSRRPEPARRSREGRAGTSGGAGSSGAGSGGAGTSGPGPRARLSLTMSELYKQRAIEVSALILLGFGGLFLPFPLWLVGAALVVVSRAWGYRDKWIGLAVPLVVVLVAVAVIASSQAIGSDGVSPQAFVAALRARGLLFFKAGAVLGAAYLGWRFFTTVGRPAGPRWQRPARRGR